MLDKLKLLSDKQKLYVYLGIAIVFIMIFIKVFIYPVFSEHTSLEKQINNQKSLQQYLLTAKKSLIDNKIFPNLTTQKAKSIINNTFSSIKKSTIVADKNIILTANNQNFSKILRAINSLKINHGIVVLQAKINKTKEGLVDAKLTFKYP